MPTLGFHVPDDSPLALAVKECAAADGSPSVSAYVRKIVERSIEGGGPADAMSPTVMVDLTVRLLGEIDAEEMAQLMAGRDQRKELRWLLKTFLAQHVGATHEAIAAEGAQPTPLPAQSFLAMSAAETMRQVADEKAAKASRDPHKSPPIAPASTSPGTRKDRS